MNESKTVNINLGEKVKEENTMVETNIPEETEVVNVEDTNEEEKNQGSNLKIKIDKGEDKPLEDVSNNTQEDELIIDMNQDKNCKRIPNKEESVATNFIQGLLSYVKGDHFDKKITEQAKINGLGKREIANNFAMTCLGKLSDILHIALDTIADAFCTLVSLLAGLFIKGGDLIVRCAKRLVRVVTLNATCTQA